MKNIKDFSVIIFLLITFSCMSQERNFLTQSEFNNILVDGVKWKDICETRGEINEMKTLFSNTITYKRTDDPDSSIGFWDSNKGFYFDFEDRSGNGNHELVYFSIDNTSSNITIKGMSIKLGDHISNLGNIKINTYSDGTKRVIFINENSESDGLFIKCSATTNEIIEIEYILFD